MKFTVEELLKYNNMIKNEKYHDKTLEKFIIIQENSSKKPEVEVIKIGENAWRPSKNTNDIKKINGIINKLTDENLDKLVLETKELDYKNPDIVGLIFKKAIDLPEYGLVYAEFCEILDLHELITELCLEQFKKLKHKNLSKFIGVLYTKNVLFSIEVFVDVLLNEIDDVSNLEILIELIKTVGPKNPEFKDILNHLNIIKKNYNSKRIEYVIDHLIKLSSS